MIIILQRVMFIKLLFCHRSYILLDNSFDLSQISALLNLFNLLVLLYRILRYSSGRIEDGIWLLWYPLSLLTTSFVHNLVFIKDANITMPSRYPYWGKLICSLTGLMKLMSNHMDSHYTARNDYSVTCLNPPTRDQSMHPRMNKDPLRQSCFFFIV